MTNAIINTYLFEPSISKESINIARELSKSDQSDEILNIVDGINNIMQLNFGKIIYYLKT